MRRPRARSIRLAALGLVLALSPAARAVDAPPTTTVVTVSAPAHHDPLFLGYGTEPAMDFGGRTVASVQDLISRIFARTDAAHEHPGLAPAWEFPAAATLILLQHEVGGHGGRAREFGLGPSYSFGFLAGATGTARPPETNEQVALIAGGGVEADGVMADRILRDALRPEGVDGAKMPLAFMAKLDSSVYVWTCPEPKPGSGDRSFEHEYRNGNDIAIYLVGRQGQRLGVPPAAIWDGAFDQRFEDPLLHDTWREARAAAVWNALDPSLAMATYAWFRQHVLDGAVQVHEPALDVGGARLTVGTRAALGPQSISRFLDVHVASRLGVATLYLRDLDSSVDRSYGWGAALHELPLGPLLVSAQADLWEEPASRENLHRGNGWNASAEADWSVGRAGLALKAGDKSSGHYPGTPAGDGAYAQLGAMVMW